MRSFLVTALIATPLLATAPASGAGTLTDRDNGLRLAVTAKKRVTLTVPRKFTRSDALLRVGCTSGKGVAHSALIDFQFIDSDRTQSGRGTFYPGDRRFCRVERSPILGTAPTRVVAKFKLR